tara:strand:- start:1 stop:339 length:339 start_codon:yes stop_codon:yes gene_type:complete
MTHTITINEMETESIGSMDNVVTKVVYTISTTNNWGDVVTKKLPCVILGTYDEDGNDITSSINTSGFTDYAALTESQVKNWITQHESALETIVMGLNQTPVSTANNNPDLPF